VIKRLSLLFYVGCDVEHETWNEFEIQLGMDPPWLLRTVAIPREEYAGTTSISLLCQNPVPTYGCLAEDNMTLMVHRQYRPVGQCASVQQDDVKARFRGSRRFQYLCMFPTSVSSCRNRVDFQTSQEMHTEPGVGRLTGRDEKGNGYHELHVQFSFLPYLIIPRFVA
jgi:hypothetical protein